MAKKEKLNKTSLILFPQTIAIGKTSLTENERLELLDRIKLKERNKKKEFITEEISDNLIDQERSDWHIHQQPEFADYFQNVLYPRLDEIAQQMISYPSKDHGLHNLFEHTLRIHDSWFARNKNGYTQPHNHGNHLYGLSFVCYLELPSKETSITFNNHSHDYILPVYVKEGDMIVFPSNLIHWAFGLEEGRSFISGNMFMLMKERECQCENCVRARLEANKNNPNTTTPFIPSNNPSVEKKLFKMK